MNDGEERYGAGPSNVRVILPLVVADDLEEGAPDLLVVGFGIRGDFVRRERSQKMVRSRDRAVEQQKPRCLEIREARDAVQETLLVSKALLQDSLDKFRAADRRSEDDEAVMSGIKVAFPERCCWPRLASQECLNSRRLDAALAGPKRATQISKVRKLGHSPASRFLLPLKLCKAPAGRWNLELIFKFRPCPQALLFGIGSYSYRRSGQ